MRAALPSRTAPRMTQTSSTLSSSACSRAIWTASEKFSQATAPVGAKRPSRDSTIFIRPGNGRLGKESQVARPMITGLPIVSSRNFRRSDFKRQGKAPAWPMTPFSARATGPKVRWTVNALDSDRRADARVSLVIFDNNVLRFELKQVVPGGQLQPWELIWSAC